MRIALDLRWLQQAYRNSYVGAVGGIGVVSQGLYLGLARAFPKVELVALVDRGDLPDSLLGLIRAAPKHRIQPVGLSGAFAHLNGRGNYLMLMRWLESEFGFGMSLKNLKSDVLHLLDHTPPPRNARCPTVVTVYDLIGLAGAGVSLRESLLLKIARNQFSKINRASRLVAISKYTRDQLAASQLLVNDKDPSVIYPGVDTERFRQSSFSLGEMRQRFNIHHDYFMHVGVLTDRKNPVRLIKALQHIVESGYGNILLVCVGPYQVIPHARERVVQLAREHGVENQVIILGDVTTNELSGLYHHSRGLIFPSLAEGFGLPPLECLACGTPCIVSNFGSLPEAVGGLGILVDPYSEKQIAEAMLRLLTDRPYQEMSRQNSPAWAENFSYEAMASKYMAIYHELV